MRILLTGGAGFIGSHLAERFLDRREDLVILDNFDAFYDPSIKERNLEKVRAQGEFILYRENLLDQEVLLRVFEQHRPQVVVHLAARAGVRPSLIEPELYCEVNITGTVRLLDLAQKFKVEHFVFGSSSSVYGAQSRSPFQEDDPVPHPISPYAATKRAGELLAFVYSHNHALPVTCLRFFTVYGPRQRPEMAIHSFTRKVWSGEEIEVYHRGESERDYTYVDDIVQGILAALDHPSGFEIFNLGNSRTIRLLDLIHLIEQNLGRKARVRLMPAQPGDVPLTHADISRAKERLGYSPATPIEEGISRFVDWFLVEQS